MWRVLVQHEQPAVRADESGLTFVTCAQCSAVEPIQAELLLVRSADDVPSVIAALSREQLADQVPVLKALHSLAADVASDIPVVIPRDAAHLALTRDVPRDLANPAACIAELTPHHPPLIVETYAEFLAQVSGHEARKDALHRVDGALRGLRADAQRWLEDHPDAFGPDEFAILADLITRAGEEGDDDAARYLVLVRDLLVRVSTGVSPADALAASASGEASPSPARHHLWAAAHDDAEPVAVAALREITRTATAPAEVHERRAAASRLAARLLERGDPEGHEEALALLEDARSWVPDRDEVWIDMTGNLSAAYGRRVAGDLLDNWENAVALGREANEVISSDSRTRAMNRTNLGLALAERPGGSTRADNDEALQWLYLGLQDRSPESDLVDWAYSKINLGMAHRRRHEADDVERAVAHFDEGLQRLRGTAHPRLIAYLALNLANALLAREAPDITAVLAAIAEGHAQAELLDDRFLLTWGHNLRGNAYAAQDGRHSPAAITHWENAVDLLDPVRDAARMLDYGQSLFDAYLHDQNWSALASVSSRMLTAAGHLYDLQTTIDSRHHVVRENPLLARGAAYALARVGRVAEAVEALEAGRVRDLASSVARDPDSASGSLAAVRPDLAARYASAVEAHSVSSSMYQVGSPRAAASRDALAAHRALNDVIGEIRGIPGFESFVVRTSVIDSLRRSGVRQAVYVASMPNGSVVLCAREGADGVEFDARHVDRPTSTDVVSALLLNDVTLGPGLLLAQLVPDASNDGYERSFEHVRVVFASLLDAVSEFAAAVEGVTVLIPTGLSGLVPWQALPAMPGGPALDELYELHLAPSLGVYAASHERAVRRVPPVLVGAADADRRHPLPGARAEVETIAAGPGWDSTAVAVGDGATVEWLVEHASKASHLHLACHGSNDVDSPDGSRLHLAGGTLGVTELARLRLVARVAVASACQSGHFAASAVPPDEFVGLAAALLKAGSACVVVSLWPVDDEAAALFMTKFYEFLDSTQPAHAQDPQRAIRQTRLWLRGLSETDRDTYVAGHPALADALRRHGVVRRQRPRTPGGRTPFGSLVDWGAFVAYGC